MAKRIDDIISLDPQEAFEYSGSEIAATSTRSWSRRTTNDPTQIEPQLAESWEATPDGKSWTFHLRADRKFASGSPVTAEDAAFSLQRAVILNKSPGFIIGQFGFTKDNVEQRIRATDARTLVIEIAERQAPTFLLYCLSADGGRGGREEGGARARAGRRPRQCLAEDEQRRVRALGACGAARRERAGGAGRQSASTRTRARSSGW